jgi:hypothetical protein
MLNSFESLVVLEGKFDNFMTVEVARSSHKLFTDSINPFIFGRATL